jgi:hypothetical protein
MAFSQIEIRLGGLSVNTQTELTYPDGLDDLCGRTLKLFKDGVTVAKENDIDITVMTFLTEYLETEEEEG